jgi:hypothetical protein
MKALLITASLLSSWQWFLQDEKETAEAEFIATLKRESFRDSQEMQAGRAFEARVRLQNEPDGEWLTERDREDLKATEKRVDEDYINTVLEVSDMTQGGLWQPSLSEIWDNGTQVFCLYGRLDVLKLGIIDVKFSKTFEVGKYRDCPQLRMYLTLAKNAPDMTFAVSDGRNVMTDYYLRKDVEPIYSLVNQFWSWLNTYPKYLSLYVENWKSKGE